MTATMTLVSHCYHFAHFELDTEERTLRRAGVPIALQDLPMRLLIALVEGAPKTMERGELAAILWEPGTFLDVDASLNTAVARIREALGDDASRPLFVSTVPRRGYRFIASLDAGGSASVAKDASGSKGSRWGALLIGALLAGGVLAVTWATQRASSPFPTHSLRNEYITGGSIAIAPPSATSIGESVREQLLLGHHHADRRSRDGLEKSIAAFQTAAALDPESADAYSGLALSYALLGIYDYWRPLESLQPARIMAQKALTLDPASAQAHLASGLVSALSDWDWTAAKASLQKALSLAPDSAETWYWQGALFSTLGEHERALESTQKALALDPTSAVFHAGYAWQLFRARRSTEAIAQSRRAIELYPNYYDAWDNLKWIQLHLGHEAEALEAWVRADDLDDGRGDGIRRAYRGGGLRNVHRESIASQVRDWNSAHYQSPFDIALEFAALGEIEGSLEWLQRSFAERETDLVGLPGDPRFDSIRGDARFEEMVRAIQSPASTARPASPE